MFTPAIFQKRKIQKDGRTNKQTHEHLTENQDALVLLYGVLLRERKKERKN